jgi:hypothetical protein
MTRVLHDPAADAALARDGFAIYPRMAAAAVATLLASFERYAAQHRGGFAATLLTVPPAMRGEIMTAVRRVLRPLLAPLLVSYRGIGWGFAVKAAEPEGSPMPMHQDITFADGIRPGVSAWIPLIDVGARNGALEVVPGSHLLNRVPRAPGTPFVCEQHTGMLREQYVRTLELSAGDVVIMSHDLFHGSSANETAAERPAAVAVFAPVEARVVYYHRTVRDGEAWLERYDAGPRFYQTHVIGTRPPSLAAPPVPERQAQLDAAALARHLASG